MGAYLACEDARIDVYTTKNRLGGLERLRHYRTNIVIGAPARRELRAGAISLYAPLSSIVSS